MASYGFRKAGDPYVPPSWSTGTDAEIAEALEKHYAGEIDLSDYWSVGDTRLIHLNAMQAPNPNSSDTWAAQDITVIIVAQNHTDLATPINGHDKACITVQTREVLSGTSAGTAGTIYTNGDSSYDMTFTKWANLYIRTYLNDKILGAIPSGDFKSAIKSSKHYRHTAYNTSASEEVTDTLFLPSYPEIFGTASDGNYVATSPTEGTQFEYYETAANRIKYINNNGNAGSNVKSWWEGSASSYYNSRFGYALCSTHIDGSAYRGIGNDAFGLAPCFAM